MTTLLEVEDLSVQLPGPDGYTTVVDGISFAVNRGESVGLVGESGCGKSTTSTMVMRLIDKTDGVIMFDGEDIGAIPAKKFARLPMRKRIQMVFQDPTDSLNPRFTAVRAIADPILRLGEVKGGDAVRARCEALARQVGLPVDAIVIMVIVIINAVLGYAQEAKAENAVAALAQLTAVTATVVRDGQVVAPPTT